MLPSSAARKIKTTTTTTIKTPNAKIFFKKKTLAEEKLTKTSPHEELY